MFYPKPPVEQRLKKAFDLAAAVRDTVQSAADNEFRPREKYQATNLFDLNGPGYFLLLTSVAATVGLALIPYTFISRHINAERDEFRKDPARHFPIAMDKLHRALNDLPDIPAKGLLQDFARAASFTFHMEKAAFMRKSLDPDIVRSGTKELEKAAPFADASTIGIFREAYRGGSFPAPGGFVKTLKGKLPEETALPAPAPRKWPERDMLFH